MTFHKNLKTIREFLKITQADLAYRAGISTPTLIKIERTGADCSLSTAVKVFETLHTDFLMKNGDKIDFYDFCKHNIVLIDTTTVLVKEMYEY